MSRKLSRETQQKVKKLNVWSKISKIAGFVLSFAGLFATVILFATATVPAIASLIGSLIVAFGGIVGSVVLEEKARNVAECDLSDDNYEVKSFENDQTKTVEKEQPKEVVKTIESVQTNEQEDSKSL